MPVVRNYGQNLRFRPRRVVTPRSVDELVAVVRGASKLRAVGGAHSWSAGIVTDDTLVSLDRMRGVLDVDRARCQVTVQAGMRLRELNLHLDRLGLALANLGSIDSQSVAGVIATATHGTGRAFRCLSTQVARLDLVDGRGERVRLERGDPDFDGAVVGLGALGVVHSVTFDVVDAFRLHDVTGTAPFGETIERIDELVDGCDHFKLWWFAPLDDVITFQYQRTGRPSDDRPTRRWFKDKVLGVAVYQSLVALGRLSGRRFIPALNRFLTREAGRPLERTTPSYIGFLTPVPPTHRETEWAFDARDAKPLLRAYRRLLPADGHTYNFVQEIRFTKADDLWLSPAYQRDSIWLSMYNIDPRNWGAQKAKFEAFAREHGGRPHWGKEATFDRAYLESQYPRLGDFARLAARYDPERKLQNEWLAQLLGG